MSKKDNEIAIHGQRVDSRLLGCTWDFELDLRTATTRAGRLKAQ
jgi:hypothetical protein